MTDIGVEQALHYINDRLEARAGEPLNFLQQKIFRSAWEGHSYVSMINEWVEDGRRLYDASYIKDQGAKLCRLLSEVLGVRVTKPSFREAIEAALPALSLSSVTLPDTSLTICTELDCGEIRWVGRQTIVTEAIAWLADQGRILCILGITGIGKTALAARLQADATLQAQLGDVVLKQVKLDRELANFEQLVRTVLPGQDLDPDRASDGEHWVQAIVHALQQRPMILVLDMLEELLIGGPDQTVTFADPRFQRLLEAVFWADHMPSRIILTSQVRPPLLTEGRYPQRWRRCQLRGLDEDDALELFRRWGTDIATTADAAYLRRIIRVYEGHPLALKVLAGDLCEAHYGGSASVFWCDYGAEIEEAERFKATQGSDSCDFPDLDRCNQNLEDIVKRRVENTVTKLAQTAPDAYHMLCQGSLLRRPETRDRWLCRLHDRGANARKAAFATLRQRFLLEGELSPDARCPHYRLHSLVRSVARDHLQNLA